MKSFRALSIAFTAAAVLLAHQAAALSEDTKTMGGADASRFSDPDDKFPVAVNLSGGSSASSGNVDPASVRYDYDPSSGSYVPHKQ